MNFKGGKQSKKCETCNKEYYVYPGNKSSFCSKKCAFKSVNRSNRIVGTRVKRGTFYKNDIDKKCGKQFSSYKGHSRIYKRDFILSKEEFFVIVQSNCFYCGMAPSMGIDRVDSSKGYVFGNMVSCCKRCNQAKNNMTLEEFKSLIRKIFNNLHL